MLRIQKAKSFFNKVDKHFHLDGQIKSYFKLFRLMFFIFLVAHILSCSWYIMARFSQDYYEENWLNGREMYHSEWVVPYLYCMYFILMTMTTIGYGDIVPKNPLELFASLFIMLICSAIFGFTLNSINSILDELSKNTEKYKQQKRIIIDYMQKRGITKELQMRVKNYFKNVYKNGMLDTMEQEEALLEKMSLALREDLMFEDKGNILKKIPLITQFFSEKFIKQISQNVKEVHYSPGDIIDSLEEKNFADNSICFIVRGTVQFYTRQIQHKNREKNFIKQEIKLVGISHYDYYYQLQVFKEGQYFGLEQMLTNDSLDCDIKSGDFTILYCLNYDDFLSAFDNPEFFEDYEIYCMLKDKMVFYNKLEDLMLKCYSCNSNQHPIHKCPQITYIPNKNLMIKRNYFTRNNDRLVQVRKSKKKRCLLELATLESTVKSYQLKRERELMEQNSELSSQLSFDDDSQDVMKASHNNQDAVQDDNNIIDTDLRSRHESKPDIEAQTAKLLSPDQQQLQASSLIHKRKKSFKVMTRIQKNQLSSGDEAKNELQQMPICFTQAFGLAQQTATFPQQGVVITQQGIAIPQQGIAIPQQGIVQTLQGPDTVAGARSSLPPNENQTDEFEFDKGYSSKYYFPQGNPEEIAKTYNTFWKRYRKRIKTFKTRKAF